MGVTGQPDIRAIEWYLTAAQCRNTSKRPRPPSMTGTIIKRTGAHIDALKHCEATVETGLSLLVFLYVSLFVCLRWCALDVFVSVFLFFCIN